MEKTFNERPTFVDYTGIELTDVSAEDLRELLSLDTAGWLAELPQIREYYAQFGDHMPKELLSELDSLQERLESAQ